MEKHKEEDPITRINFIAMPKSVVFFVGFWIETNNFRGCRLREHFRAKAYSTDNNNNNTKTKESECVISKIEPHCNANASVIIYFKIEILFPILEIEYRKRSIWITSKSPLYLNKCSSQSTMAVTLKMFNFQSISKRNKQQQQNIDWFALLKILNPHACCMLDFSVFMFLSLFVCSVFPTVINVFFLFLFSIVDARKYKRIYIY